MGMVRRLVGLTVAAMLSVALTACSGDDGGSSEAPTTGSSAGAAIVSAPPGSPALPVLASRDASAKELPIRVDVNELRVEGRVTRLTFTARNLATVEPGESPDRWQITDFFSDGISQRKEGAAPDDAFSVDGVYLLDSAGAKRYLAARNAAKGCVCSGDLSDTFVSPGTAVVLTTIFAALPEGVDKVDVVVPRVGSFNGVAVSR